MNQKEHCPIIKAFFVEESQKLRDAFGTIPKGMGKQENTERQCVISYRMGFLHYIEKHLPNLITEKSEDYILDHIENGESFAETMERMLRYADKNMV